MAQATDKQTAKPKQPRHPVLDIINLVGGYEGTAVIKDCSMQVQKGESVVIMGGSGSGKSTFLKHLIGLKEPMSGDVSLFGDSLYDASYLHRLKLLKNIGQ